MEHTLARKDYAVFESIYRINGAARRVLHWNEFVHAMRQVGLVLQTNKGSKRVFTAQGAPPQPHFHWHEPHGAHGVSIGKDAQTEQVLRS
ncbi:hypothetical protein OH77DRAFT_1525840 [Trametes cingulata]|nr:hypothetical protein OH77DRAFT_1525840 [Trametes cingulata]